MRNYLWVVEEKAWYGWTGWPGDSRVTRRLARILVRARRRDDPDVPVRVRKYVRVEKKNP